MKIVLYNQREENYNMWHRGSKPVTCRFWLFCWIIFYTASASEYFLHNQNISFL